MLGGLLGLLGWLLQTEGRLPRSCLGGVGWWRAAPLSCSTCSRRTRWVGGRGRGEALQRGWVETLFVGVQRRYCYGRGSSCSSGQHRFMAVALGEFWLVVNASGSECNQGGVNLQIGRRQPACGASYSRSLPPNHHPPCTPHAGTPRSPFRTFGSRWQHSVTLSKVSRLIRGGWRHWWRSSRARLKGSRRS